jgi:hypothetical protein
MIDQPTAEDALRALEPLLGEWRLTSSGPDGEPWPGEGIATFAWHESGAHLIARASINVPGAPSNLSVIGCDAANGTYYQLYTDSRGVCRVYGMSIADGEWKLWRDGQPFAQRFTGRLAPDGGRIDGRWERAPDGVAWEVDFHLTYTRVA